MGHINDAASNERSAIDDPKIGRLSVVEIRYAHPGSEGQRAMRGRHLLHIVDLAVGRATPVIGMPVPARDAGFGRSEPGGGRQ